MNPASGLDVQVDMSLGEYLSLAHLRYDQEPLSVTVMSPTSLSDIVMRLEWTPAYVQPQEVWIPHLEGGVEQVIQLPGLQFDETALLSIKDEEDGVVKIELLHAHGNNERRAVFRFGFGWLPAFDRRITAEYPELTAALVLPGDTARDAALSSLPAGDSSADAVRLRLRSLWERLTDIPSAPTQGYSVRRPAEIRTDGFGSGWDAALYLAACMASIGIAPYIVLCDEDTPLVCAGLQPGATLSSLREALTIDAGLPLLDAGVLCRSGREDRSYSAAHAEGCRRLAELSDDEHEVVDVVQLWQSGILPLVGSVPTMPSADHDETEDESLVSLAPRTRMEKWQRRLLDLSLRNNLLNTRPTAKNQMTLIVPDLARLEDMLAGGSTFRFSPLPAEVAAEDDSLFSDPKALQAATELFGKRKLMAAVRDEALQRVLKGLYASSRRELEESGANTLFIACGFLHWVPKGATAALRAPLLLLPVRLNRASVRDGFTLTSQDEEVQINQTLLELLKTEFGILMPQLEGDLPKDESGSDVARIFEIVERAVAGMPGWALRRHCMLGVFSFAKFLMWRDLCERSDKLSENMVVRQLMAEERGRFPDQVDFPDPSTLDNDVDAHKVYTPLPSDSSQLAAIIAAARGKNFVLEGPPGTGKSQTIANMIAHCLGHGKTVLFVAEKAVALEVVYKRLERIGLGQFCLELHSNKTQLSSVMRQFRDAVEGVSLKPMRDEWDESVDSMTGLRKELNTLPLEMHREYPDSTTLYADVATQAEHAELPILPLLRADEDPLHIPRARRKELLDCAHELETHYPLISDESVFCIADRIRTQSYSQALEEALADCLHRALASTTSRDRIAQEAAAQFGVSDLAEKQRDVFTVALYMAAFYPGQDWSALLPSRAGRVLRVLRSMLPHAESYRNLRDKLSLQYIFTAPDDPRLDEHLRACRAAQYSGAISRWWAKLKARKCLLSLARNAERAKPDCLHDLETLVAMRAELQALDQADEHVLPEFMRKGVELTRHDEKLAQVVIDMLVQSGDGDESFARTLLEQRERFENDVRLMAMVDNYRALTHELEALAKRISDLCETPVPAIVLDRHGSAAARIQAMLNARNSWRDITLWNACVERARKIQADSLAAALLSGKVRPQQLEAAVAVSLSQFKISAACEDVSFLKSFSPVVHEGRIRDFSRREAELRAGTGAHIRAILAAGAAGITKYDRETAVLQREVSKKRMYMPLRKLLAATPHVAPLLKPCFLMSPLSVAQYLSADSPTFDVVIFDEASQIPVWDAIGAIGRGKSVIITGDSRQMPPTSFFSRSRSDEDAADDEEPELESILDECLACGVPKMDLTWHYRSKSEGLIAFSNAHYYDGKMTTFPAPALHDDALQLHYVGGLYEPGASRRVNTDEARAVVRHVVDTLRTPGFRYTEATSIGIVTFNAQQQKLIMDLLDEERAADPSLEPFFAEENPEAVFVKNLENVQGDERGVIYFSTTYGRDADGRMSMNFGPLNLLGGERRLNVAITRARYAMHLFTSMHPEDINLSRTRARGVADLRAFLEYAAKGAQMSVAGAEASRRDALAQHIARSLTALGWECRTGIGVSDYRVDIAVANPDVPNAVLAGITLDGASYRAAFTARDRDVVRPDTMRQLGWRMLNVWAIDWWRNRESCLSTLNAKLNEFLNAGQPEQAELPDLVAAADAAAQPEPEEQTKKPAPVGKVAMQLGTEYELYAAPKKLPLLFSMDNEKLNALTEDVLKAESPITQTFLLERLIQIAAPAALSDPRSHSIELTEMKEKLHHILRALFGSGFLRTHKEMAAGALDEQQTVLSLRGCPAIRPRTLGPRPLDRIPLSELGEIARLVQAEIKCLPGTDEHVRGMADFLGMGRLTKNTKALLLSAAKNHAYSSQAAANAECEMP